MVLAITTVFGFTHSWAQHFNNKMGLTGNKNNRNITNEKLEYFSWNTIHPNFVNRFNDITPLFDAFVNAISSGRHIIVINNMLKHF